MICRKCGELLGDRTKVCPVCGAEQTSSGAKLNPRHIDSADCAHEGRATRQVSPKAKPFKSKRNAKKRRFGWILPVLIVLIELLSESGSDYAWVVGLVVCIAILAAFIALVTGIVRAVRNVVQLHRYRNREIAYDMQKMR